MNIKIHYHELSFGRSQFVFNFVDLDEYEVLIEMDKDHNVESFEKVQEVTRLLNAYNAFRQWYPEKCYIAKEIRDELEMLASDNWRTESSWVEYNVAVPKNDYKVAGRIFTEKH